LLRPILFRELSSDADEDMLDDDDSIIEDRGDVFFFLKPAFGTGV